MESKKQEKGSQQVSHPSLQELQEKIVDQELQWTIECSLRNHIQLIERAIYQTYTEIQKAESEYSLNRAANLKYGRLPTLERHLKSVNTELEEIKKI
jgi:ATP-dependent Clp protease ATP-binding subunit ClpB